MTKRHDALGVNEGYGLQPINRAVQILSETRQRTVIIAVATAMIARLDEQQSKACLMQCARCGQKITRVTAPAVQQYNARPWPRHKRGHKPCEKA